MAKTNWQDPKTSEMRSTHIAGLMEAVGKVEDSIGMESVFETNVPLTEVFISSDDRYRIFQAPEGKRNWTAEQAPVIKRNGSIITSGFEIDYGGGAIILNVNDTVANTYTADVTYIKIGKIPKSARFVIGTSTAGWTLEDCDYLCDGTNDQEEINNAITALPTNGGEIVILDGTYNISARIVLNKPNITLKGNGKSTILKQTYNEIVNTGAVSLSASSCTIENFIFDGNRGAYDSFRNWAISSYNLSGIITEVNDTIVRGILILDVSGDYCINLKGSRNHIINNSMLNSKGGGIYVQGGNHNIVSDNIIIDCNVGISVSNTSHSVIGNNLCIRGTGLTTDYTASQHTILLSGTSNNYNLISSNNCMGKAVVISGGTGNSAWGNKFDNTDDLP